MQGKRGQILEEPPRRTEGDAGGRNAEADGAVGEEAVVADESVEVGVGTAEVD